MSNNVKHTTESLSIEVAKYGYTLLSEYKGSQNKIKLKCPKGHIIEMRFISFYYNKKRCKICSYEKRRTTIKEMQDYLNKFRYTLLSNEVKGERDIIEVVCPFGVINHFSFRDFKVKNKRCKCSSCTSHKHDDKLKDIRSFLSEMGYSLISTSYKDCDHKLDLICNNGHKISMPWSKIKKGNICFTCSRMSRRMKYNNVKKYIEDESYILLSGEYKNASTILNMICPNGHTYNANWNSFQRGHRCKKCYDDAYRGESHHFWKPEITEEERRIKREFPGYRKWRRTVLKRDSYTCQCCGYHKGDGERYRLHVHHKDGYSWCVERRTDVSNGVVLCEKCHFLFHHIYGNKNNTEEQFYEFISIHKEVDDVS